MQLYSTTNGPSANLSSFLADLVARNLENVLKDIQAESEVESAPEPVKLACSDVEALIVDCCEKVKAMAWKFVRNASRLEFDDMYSIGMLAVCEAAPLLKPDLNPFPYLLRAAKFAMIDEYRRARGFSSVSLDAPLFDDSDRCLADEIPASAPVAAVVSEQEQAVVDAVLRLPSERQRSVLARRFGLEGYGACNLKETAGQLQTTVAAVEAASLRGRRSLAQDAGLREVVGVEVQS
jgi:RNA polymerase sigma factor (sigma-70 family)